MRISLSSFIYFNYPLPEAIRRTAAAGFEGIDIWGGRPHAAPDPGGAEFWTSEIERVVSLGIYIREGFQGLANFFFDSSEYALMHTTDRQFVADLYQTFFSRPPDPEGEAFWLGQLAAGLTRTMLVMNFSHSRRIHPLSAKHIRGHHHKAREQPRE